tara:strand:+ start:204 stop:401 length:198 start_codon:yes stop_codon:yes gene_type:complete
MMAVVKGKLDKLVEKVISRKFLVWISATSLMAYGMIESSDWVIISGLYLGGQSVIDGIVKMKSGM